MNNYLQILFGIVCASLGVFFLKSAMIASGGTAGIALSASYITGLSFSAMFFLINIPFYLFSFYHLGTSFTINSIVSVTLLSFFASLDRFLPVFYVPMWMGAVIGGLLIGYGLAKMFINGASLGGFNIMSVFLQKRLGIDPGKTNFGFDFMAVLFSFYAVGISGGLFSVATIAIVSKVISYYKNEMVSYRENPQKEQNDCLSEPISSKPVSVS